MNQEEQNHLWTVSWLLSHDKPAEALKEVHKILKYTPPGKAKPKPVKRSRSKPPSPDTDSMVAYYGRAGNEANLVRIPTPYRMVLSWDKRRVVTTLRCHQKIAKPLTGALTQIAAEFTQTQIEAMGLHLYAGIFNDRSVRGGRSKSKHAWGAAIDLNPEDNGNRTPWREDRISQPGYASMPVRIIEIFEEWGFKSGARAWGRDAMHFQYTT